MHHYKPYEPRPNLSSHEDIAGRSHENFSYQNRPLSTHPPPIHQRFVSPQAVPPPRISNLNLQHGITGHQPRISNLNLQPDICVPPPRISSLNPHTRPDVHPIISRLIHQTGAAVPPPRISSLIPQIRAAVPPPRISSLSPQTGAAVPPSRNNFLNPQTGLFTPPPRSSVNPQTGLFIHPQRSSLNPQTGLFIPPRFSSFNPQHGRFIHPPPITEFDTQVRGTIPPQVPPHISENYDNNFIQGINAFSSKINLSSGESKDEHDWLQNWVRTTLEMKKITGLKLQTVQEDVLNCAKLLCHLDALVYTATNEGISPSENSMNNHQFDSLKFDISKMLKKLHSPEYKQAARNCVISRRVKRKILKKNKGRNKQLKLKERNDRNKAIDDWRQLLIKQKLDEAQEEALKSEADKVLCEVRRKQEQAQKMISLLENLRELRQTRIKSLSASGVPVSKDGSKLFNHLSGNIQKKIEAQLGDYELEERTLRVMMQKTPSHAAITKNTKIPSQLKLQGEISHILFGSHEQENESSLSQESIPSFVERRNEWDKFISSSELASAVPVGWVVPPQIASEGWNKYRCTNK